MKIPPPPPHPKTLFSKDINFLENLEKPELQKLLKQSIDKYPYWDTLKYWSMPHGTTQEMCWAYRQWLAVGREKTIKGLTDYSGKTMSYWLTEKAVERLHRIDKHNKAEFFFMAKKPSKQWQDRYRANQEIDEIIATNQIEGNTIIASEAREIIRAKRQFKDKKETMIVGSAQVMEKLSKLKDQPLSLDMIKELHQLLVKKTMKAPEPSRRIRELPEDNEIRIYDADGTILHVPPRAEDLPERLSKLIEFTNKQADPDFIHPVIKALIIHFWILHDHPFTEDNGRLARAISYWYLLRQGYDLFELLPISRMIYRAKNQYKQAFVYSALASDLNYFILFTLRAIDLALRELQWKVSKSQGRMNQWTQVWGNIPGFNRRQKEVLVDALKHPGRSYTLFAHQSIYHSSYQTARLDLFGLADKGLLKVSKTGKTFIFAPENEKITALIKLPNTETMPDAPAPQPEPAELLKYPTENPADSG